MNVLESPEEESVHMGYEINVENDKFPFCIVWTPIPLITYLIPIVGHMGICMSSGQCFISVYSI